jgi:aminotransferase
VWHPLGLTARSIEGGISFDFGAALLQNINMALTDASITQAATRMLSAKAEQFTESVIREMTRLAQKHNAVNLSQGFPDFAAPAEIKDAARQAISDDINQYAITWGAKPLRDAIVEKFARTQNVRVDPEREITICCGSTEAMMSAMMAIINPGDEIVVFEPFYENYGPDAILSGATPRFVRMQPPKDANAQWSYDPAELSAAFNKNTKAIILNTPNNPTGKVFTRAELEFIRDLCVEHNTYCITDEIYEHILYDGTEHLSMAQIDGMRERTIVINGLSKTYSVTGWRVGWAIAPPAATQSIRKVHDFLTVGAAAPLQQAGAAALKFPQSYYEGLAKTYAAKRERLLTILTAARFTVYKPRGAYYIMTDISGFTFPYEDARFAAPTRDVAFAKYLVQEIGVACVPGSSFYNNSQDGAAQVRFTFCKKEETLAAAEERFAKLML